MSSTAAFGDEPTPAAPTPEDDDGYVELTNPNDARVYRVRAENRERFINKYGWSAPSEQPTIDRDEVHKSFNDWTERGNGLGFYAGQAVDGADALATGAVQGAVGLNTVATHLLPAAGAKWWANHVKEQNEAHPYLTTIGSLAGGLGEAAAGGAALKGLGLVASGAEALRGAQGLEQGAEGLGSWLKLAGKGAVAGGAEGELARLDDASLQHVNEPMGQEKLLSDTIGSGNLWDMALGAAVPVGLRGLGKAVGRAGRGLEGWGKDTLTERSINKDVYAQMATRGAGKEQEVGDYIKDLVDRHGRKGAREHARTLIEGHSKNLGDLINYIGDHGTLDESGKRQVLHVLDNHLHDFNELGQKVPLAVMQTAEFRAEMAKLNAPGGYSIGNLVNIKQLLNKGVSHRDFAARPNNVHIDAAVHGLNDIMGDRFKSYDKLAGTDTLGNFLHTNKQLELNNYTKNIVRKGDDVKSIKDVVQQAATVGGLGFAASGLSGAMGMGGIGAAGGASAATFATINLLTNLRLEHAAQASKSLGRVFIGVDNRLTSAIERGLYGLPMAGVISARAHKDATYDEAAANVSASAGNLMQTTQNIRQSYQDAGVPDHIADEQTQRAVAVVSHLAGGLPKRRDPGDFVTRDQGDPVQQMRWMGQYRTAIDPSYGLQHPSASNLATLKALYPTVFYAAQQAVYSQTHNNPDLPMASKDYASRILGRPINHGQAPAFSQMLQAARQKAAAQEQAGAQGRGGSSKKPVSSDQSSSTRLDGLQGGS